MIKKALYLLIALTIFPVLTATAKSPFVYIVEIRTTVGNITVKLYNETPLHRDNFVKLCRNRNYDGVLFHRVIKDFMIQAGDPESKSHEPEKVFGDGDLGYTLPAEIVPELFHKKGVLAAARESDKDNPLRNSSASQFYITVGKKFSDQELENTEKRINKANKTDNFKFSPEVREIYRTKGGTPHLDLQYTVFGEVIKGQEVADKISLTQTNDKDRPIVDIWIKSTRVHKKHRIK